MNPTPAFKVFLALVMLFGNDSLKNIANLCERRTSYISVFIRHTFCKAYNNLATKRYDWFELLRNYLLN